MKLGYFFVLFAAVCALLGCSKPEATLSEVKNKDLGVVNLSYDVPGKQDIGSGFTCIFTAKQMTATSCELIVKIEKSGKMIDSRRLIPALLDKPAELPFENGIVTFTPHIQ
jgi:hypothetical protein